MWSPAELLHHRGSMLLIDRILGFGEGELSAAVDIRPGIPFFEPGRGVPAWIGLEYMAQTIAALAGVHARRSGAPLPLGLLIGCRHYRNEVAYFATGAVLTVHIREVTSDGQGLGAFHCTIMQNGVLAESQISTIVLPPARTIGND